MTCTGPRFQNIVLLLQTWMSRGVDAGGRHCAALRDACGVAGAADIRVFTSFVERQDMYFG